MKKGFGRSLWQQGEEPMNLQRLLLGSLVAETAMVVTRTLFAASEAAQATRARTFYDAIDAYIEQQAHRLHIPGASLAIVEGDKIVHRRGFGRARPGGDVPTPTTPFFIGSLTKSITALAVMQLVEAGKVELDAPVQRCLPWFRVADPSASAQMTVRHLLNQTRGLPMVAGNAILADLDDRPNATERQVWALATLKITRPVGSKWEYSNLNYNVPAGLYPADHAPPAVDPARATRRRFGYPAAAEPVARRPGNSPPGWAPVGAAYPAAPDSQPLTRRLPGVSTFQRSAPFHAPLHARPGLDGLDQRGLHRDMGLLAHRVGPPLPWKT
jgi:hypothetical protein